MSRPLCCLALAGALLAGLAAAPLPVARAAATPPGFAEAIDVRVVNVEAVVTDRAGARVRGLGPADFRLRVDGQEVAIEYFTEVSGGEALAAPDGTVPAPAFSPGDPLPTSYLVFIDEFFTLDPDRRLVLRDLAGQLGELAPGDRLAVVAWTGRELEMLATWSGEPAAIERVLADAAARRGHGLERLAEQISFGIGRDAAVRRAFRVAPYRLTLDERAYAERLADQVGRGVDAAAAALRGFGAPPGRRVLVLLAGGWPYSPIQFVAGDRLRPVYEERIPEGEELFAPLVEAANRLGYTVYPVDVGGLQSGAGIALASTSGLGRDLDFTRENEIHYGFDTLARSTGGRALLNAGRTRALAGVAADTRSFYWLGFTPRWQGDGAAHEITVEVLRPGTTARARDGYRDLAAEQQRSLTVESAALFGNPAGLDPLTVSVGRAEKAGWGKVNVPLTLAIPAESVTLTPTAGGYAVRLELYVAAVDAAGASAEVPVVGIVLNEPSPPRAGSTLSYVTSLTLRRQAHDLVVALYDPATGRMLSGAARVDL